MAANWAKRAKESKDKKQEMLETSQLLRELSSSAGKKAVFAHQRAEEMRNEYDFEEAKASLQAFKYIIKPHIQPL